MRGLLVRQIPVRLVDLSISGFLLESDSAIDVGATGQLQIDFGGIKYSDQARVARSVTRPGANLPFRLGGEFSWGDRPSQTSMRLAVRTFETNERPAAGVL